MSSSKLPDRGAGLATVSTGTAPAGGTQHPPDGRRGAARPRASRPADARHHRDGSGVLALVTETEQRSLLERLVGRPLPWLACMWAAPAVVWIVMAVVVPSGFQR